MLPAYTVMVSPGVPVPLKVGVLSAVRLSVLLLPVSLAGTRSGAAGVVGAAVSIRTGTVVAGLVLPAGSVAVTRTFCSPSASACVGVTLQVPSAATTVVRTSPVGMVTVIVSPGVAVPVMVGVVSLVVLSVLLTPVSLAAATSAAGAAGGVVSRVKPPARAGLILPAMSAMPVLVVQAPSMVS